MHSSTVSGFVAPLVAAGLVLVAGPAPAQTPEIMDSGRRTMTAERMLDDERIVLDGVLDEPAWGRAQHGGEFIMQDPVLGGAPTERTEVRVVFNRDHLYIGATMFDSEPDRLRGNTRKRDEFLSADDRFMWTMDTFLNQQTGYFFEMNPSGLMADALKGPSGSNAREWDGIWNAKARQSEIGWVLEIDIPFRSIAFDPNAPAWGINFQRTVRRKQEELLWTGHQRNQGLQRMANAGLLLGLRDISPGRGFELRPYVSGYAADAPGRAPSVARDTSGDVGIDMAYNLTPSLRAVATVNTDFAETEVDQRLVNLTRFPLFLPERRTFFLDGVDLLRPALQCLLLAPHRPGQRPAQADHRRDQAERPGRQQRRGRPLRADRRGGQQPRARASWSRGGGGACCGSRISARSTPAASTHDGSASPGRHTAGADFRFSTATFLGNKNLTATGYWVANSTGHGIGDSAAYSGRVEYLNDIWESAVEFQEVQKDYNPAVGFTPRREYRLYNPELTWSPRPTTRHPFIRRFRFGLNPTVFTDLQNRKQTVEFDTDAVPPRAAQRRQRRGAGVAQLRAARQSVRDRPGGHAARRVRLPVPPLQRVGEHRQPAHRRPAPPRRVGHVLLGHAHRVQPWASTSGRAPGVRVNTTYEYNRVALPQGRFDTRLLRVVADTQFSPFMYLVNNVQYDSVSRGLGWQSRYRWIVRPGNDIFLVYTHNWIEDRLDPGNRFLTLDRRGAAKVVYTKRF